MNFILKKDKILVLFYLILIFTNLHAEQSKIDFEILSKSKTSVNSVVASDDGKYIAFGKDNSVILWNLLKNKAEINFSNFSSPINSLNFSPNSKWLLAVENENFMTVQNLEKYKNVIKLEGLENNKIFDAVFGDSEYKILVPYSTIQQNLNNQQNLQDSFYNIDEFFNLILSNQYSISHKFNVKGPIKYLDKNENLNRLLICYQDGSLEVVDLFTNEVIWNNKIESLLENSTKNLEENLTASSNSQEIEKLEEAENLTEAESQQKFFTDFIKPKFSPDGTKIVFSENQNTLCISKIIQPQTIKITETENFINSAIFSSNGKSLVTCLSNGDIKIFDTQTNEVLKHYSILGDVATSLCYSKEERFLFVGTKRGFVIKIDLAKTKAVGTINIISDYDDEINQLEYTTDFVPNPTSLKKDKDGTPMPKDSKKQTSEQTPPPDQQQPQQEKPDNYDFSKQQFTQEEVNLILKQEKLKVPHHQIPLCVGISTIDSKNFIGALTVQTGYNNFSLYPFYFGGGLNIAAFVPSNNFPFDYFIGSVKVPAPWLYQISLEATAGLSTYFPKAKTLCFAELNVGASGRALCNNNTKSLYIGKISYSPYVQVNLGLDFVGIKLSAGVKYDFATKVNLVANVGYVFKIKSKSQKSKNLIKGEK